MLEHTSKELGEAYLKLIKSESPSLIKQIESFKENVLIGCPIVYEFDEIGSISPSTLRYIKVASDLIKYFGESIGEHIAEIGVGYGGQILIADKIFEFKQYDLLDVQPVLSLAFRYLEAHNLQSTYKPITLNQHQGNIAYDLVIINYAFSELLSKLQRRYINKILSKAKRG